LESKFEEDKDYTKDEVKRIYNSSIPLGSIKYMTKPELREKLEKLEKEIKELEP